MRLLSLRILLLIITAITIAPLAAPAQLKLKRTRISDTLDEPKENPLRRRAYFYGMRAYPFGNIPQNARLEAIRHTESILPAFATKRSSGLQSVNSWRQIGPQDVGGRVRTIVLHPTDKKTIWIGAADGGVWKSTNRGDSWFPVMDSENAIAMGALAIDPQNPNVLYAGTGEIASSDSYKGAGIMKSTDGGNTWKPFALTSVGAFSKIVVSPKDSKVIYAGATKNGAGLYRSTDGGANWQRLSDLPIVDITMNPVSTSELWFGTSANGILHTVDGGNTIVPANTGIAVGTIMERASVAVAPSNPAIVYALLQEAREATPDARRYARIYKSTNSGQNWTRIYNDSPRLFDVGAGPQGTYDNVIGVHSTNPDIVLAGGIRLARTTSGGSEWKVFNAGFSGGPIHDDQHGIAFDPNEPNVVFVTNDGGVYRSTNAGESFTRVNGGLYITQFYDIAVDQSSQDIVYGGSQDNGTLTTHSTRSGDIEGGDGGYVLVDPDEPHIVYGQHPNGQFWKANIQDNTGYYCNGGLPPEDSAAWATPIVMDPTNPKVLYSGFTRVWRSLDGAETPWEAVSPWVSGFISSIAVSSVDNQVIYAGSSRGSLIVSTDGGEVWKDYTYNSGIANRAITDIEPSRKVAGTAYASVSGFFTAHVFKTTNYGATWVDISLGLPDIPVNTIALHPDDENVIFVGTDIGVFITVDGGATWSTYNEGLPRVVVSDLEIHKSRGMLVLGSYGRSMFEIALEKPTPVPSITAPIGGEVWFRGLHGIISWNGFEGPVKLEYSTDDGASWYPLAQDVIGNTFRWNIAIERTMFARIRVTSQQKSQSAISRSFTVDTAKIGSIVSMTTVPTLPYGITFDGEYLWATNFEGKTLLKLDPVTLETVDAVEMNVFQGDSLFTDITYHPEKGTFFIHRLASTVPNGLRGWLYEVTKEGVQLNVWPSPAEYPIGLAWLGKEDGGVPYLFASDRNGNQEIYWINPNDGAVTSTFPRAVKIPNGPRGATAAPGGRHVYQIITNFNDEILLSSAAQRIDIESTMPDGCTVTLQSPYNTLGIINARGIEIDPSDKNFWVTDYIGNIYKVASCEGYANIKPIPTSIVADRSRTEGIALGANGPNPFSQWTEIPFTLQRGARAEVRIYDMRGMLIASLGERSYDAGSHSVRFMPEGLAAGAYRYVLAIDGHEMLSRTMVYLK